MEHFFIDTRQTPIADRVAHWAEINRQHFGALDVDGLDSSTLEARLRLFRLNDLKVYLIDAPAHGVRRTARAEHDALDDSFKLLFQKQGASKLQIAGKAFTLEPGDWSLYDPRQPYVIRNQQAASLLVIQVPRDRFRGLLMPELHTCETHGGQDASMSMLLGTLLQSLSVQLPSLPDESAALLSENVLSLLTFTLANQDSSIKHGQQALPAILKARVRQYVQQHISDADLTLDSVAVAMGCSKRYLHRVFEDDEQTLDRYIWQLRLDLARVRLESSQHGDQSISQICYAAGFRSNVHFCRLFKETYQLSPSAYRRSHQA